MAPKVNRQGCERAGRQQDLLELEEHLPSLRKQMMPLEQKKFDTAIAAGSG